MRKILTLSLFICLFIAFSVISKAQGPPPMAFPQKDPTLTQVLGVFTGAGDYLKSDGTKGTPVSGGVAGKVCKTITNPSDADNILFDIAAARTITKISGICVGGTSVVITLQDAGATGSGSTSIDDAITIDTDGANGGTISYAVHDGDIIKLDVGTVTGVVTQLMVCYE